MLTGWICPTLGWGAVSGRGVPNPGGSSSGGVLPNPGGSASGGRSAQPMGVCPVGSASRGVSAQPRGVCIQGGVCPTQGDLPNPGGVCPTQRVCIWGVCLGWSASRDSAQPPSGLPMEGLGRPLSPVNRMTHRCKNITLPQTSFAGGNYSL